jgi:hypothetical protein
MYAATRWLWKERGLEIEGESTRSHSVENWRGKRPWTSRMTGYGINKSLLDLW